METKEITYEALKRECEPKYILKYQETGSIIQHERKFKNPVLLRDFIKSLGTKYTWTIYKKG